VASGGSALDYAWRMSRRVYGPTGNSSTSRVDGLCKELNELGYCSVPPGLVEQSDLDDFEREAEAYLATQFGSREELDATLRGDTKNVKEMWFLPEAWVLEQPLTWALLENSVVQGVVDSYLAVPPVLSQANAWFSLVSDSSSLKGSAQQWHFDCDRIRWLKVFLYVTDVNAENGPHEFVAGTHRKLPKMGTSSRLPSSLVQERFTEDRLKSFRGERGTLIFEDTRGLHRGRPVVAGHRLILQLEFAVDLFGADAVPLPEQSHPRFATSPSRTWSPRLTLRGW